MRQLRVVTRQAPGRRACGEVAASDGPCCIGVLAEPVEPLPAATRCAQVHAMLVERPELDMVAVVDRNEKPVGVVNRLQFLTRWSQRFIPELYERRPVTSVMDRAPLVVDAKASVDEVSAQITAAHRHSLAGGCIMTENGRYAGLCSTLALMRAKVEISHARALDLLRAREEAERANRAKSDFLAHMSHELRTPLNAILGFSDILRSELFGAMGNPRYREYAGDIHALGTLLLSVINDILDLAKAEAGKHELFDEIVAPSELVEPCLRLVVGRAADAGLRVKNRVAVDLPLLRADIRKVKQILINLLSNAIKFTPPGGRVRIDAGVTADGALWLSVADTGIGMAPDEIPRALEPFGQIDSTLSRRFEGTGLGLPLVRSLCDLHGAALKIASRPGEGTTVTVEFPPERVTAPMQPALAAGS
jgi:two-component system cell cycle sensor histidine kinase PleC